MEKLKAKKFCNKSIDPSVDELWNQLFEDSYATRENVVTPSMDSGFVQPMEPCECDCWGWDKESGMEDKRYNENDGDMFIQNIINMLLVWINYLVKSVQFGMWST